MISYGGRGADRDASFPEFRGASWLHEGECFDSPRVQKGHLLEPSEPAPYHQDLSHSARCSFAVEARAERLWDRFSGRLRSKWNEQRDGCLDQILKRRTEGWLSLFLASGGGDVRLTPALPVQSAVTELFLERNGSGQRSGLARRVTLYRRRSAIPVPMWVMLLFVCFQLKEKSQSCGGNTGPIEELRGAIYLAEEACPGISDTMVAQLVQRLQR